MSATRKNVAELVRALRHMCAQSDIRTRNFNTCATLQAQDVNDVLRALAEVEKPAAKRPKAARK